MADELQVRIVRALHADDAARGWAEPDLWDMTPEAQEWYAYNAAAVLPIVAEEVRKAKAEALREAAERYFFDRTRNQPVHGYALLHHTADEYETGDSDEHR